MTSTSSSTTQPATRGYTNSGRIAAPWAMGDYAPAGNVRSTPADMVRYLSAQMDGSAPGVAATQKRAEAGSGEIGYGWHINDEVTWHNCATGGFSSWVGFRGDRGVVVLSNTSTSVDDLGLDLVGGAA